MPHALIRVSDHRKSDERTETQTGNADLLEVCAFYCEQDTPYMINKQTALLHDY